MTGTPRGLPSRFLTWAEIESEFGPLTEIPFTSSGDWNVPAIRDALDRNLLWTRTDPGLVSTGLHYVNRDCYFMAARPYPEGVDICEVDYDFTECVRCGDGVWDSPDGACDECRSLGA